MNTWFLLCVQIDIERAVYICVCVCIVRFSSSVKKL